MQKLKLLYFPTCRGCSEWMQECWTCPVATCQICLHSLDKVRTLHRLQLLHGFWAQNLSSCNLLEEWYNGWLNNKHIIATCMTSHLRCMLDLSCSACTDCNCAMNAKLVAVKFAPAKCWMQVWVFTHASVFGKRWFVDFWVLEWFVIQRYLSGHFSESIKYYCDTKQLLIKWKWLVLWNFKTTFT